MTRAEEIRIQTVSAWLMGIKDLRNDYIFR